MLKSNNKLEGDHVTHFKSWIKTSIAHILVWKCSYVDDTIELGFMMWVSFTMDENRQEGKQLNVKCKALKWIMPFIGNHFDEFSW